MDATARLLALVALSWALCAGIAQAQSYPSKVVRIVVPFPPGGPTDLIARSIAQSLGKVWSQPVIVENRPGADTIVGAEYVARAAPDGHTVLLASSSTLTVNPYFYASLPYDPRRDFAPVLNLVKSVPVLVASPKMAADTLQGFIALARAKPGEVAYGYFAASEHLLTLDMSARAGIHLNHVPYKGAADVLPALMSGHIDVAFMSVSPALPHIRSRKIRPLAYAGTQRAGVLPDVPTLAETVAQDLETGTWFGLVVRATTPREIIMKIAADVSRITGTADFDGQFVSAAGLELLNLGPDQYAEFLAKERVLWAVRAKTFNLKPR
jgi:tripartite-type tricarboxylate transporter receptor subunit TctC